MMSMISRCPICKKENLSDKYCLLGFYAPDLVAQAQPGQFVNLQIPRRNDLLLKRPFSIHRIDLDEQVLYVLFKVVGQGTQILSQLSLGDELEVLGPLGTGFTLREKENVLLIGGGIGAAPLYQLGRELFSRGNQVTTLLGLTSVEDLVLVEAMGELNPEWILVEGNGDDESASFQQVLGKGATTGVAGMDGGDDDSGTAASNNTSRTEQSIRTARQGLVTDLVAELGTQQFDQIYTCGPHPMLAALQKMLTDQLVDCQFSMEEKMGCGIGLCFSCTCKVTDGEATDGWSNQRICTRGPVFRGDEVIL